MKYFDGNNLAVVYKNSELPVPVIKGIIKCFRGLKDFNKEHKDMFLLYMDGITKTKSFGLVKNFIKKADKEYIISTSENILKGTASEQEVLFYYDHTVDPIMNTFALEFKEKFLSKTARTQRQDLMYFRDPFKLVPAKDLAEIADKFTRNAILSSNEIRAEIGYKPVDEPIANELSNKNLNADKRDTGEVAPENNVEDDASQ